MVRKNSRRGHAPPKGYAAPGRLTLNHLKLVRRDLREVTRFRTWLLSAQAGAVEHADVLHEADGSCCRREHWHVTAATLALAIRPGTPTVIVNF
jgi:hypothetical protein